MNDKKQGRPGVSRANRISDEGLMRLEKQLAEGRQISEPVLRQWVLRYGKAAQDILTKYGLNIDIP